MGRNNIFQRVYRLVKKVPRGRVVTYGQVAAMLGDPRAARTVGWALHAINDPHSGIPWHRVINASGRLSYCNAHSAILQRKLLEAEGIKFRKDDSIDLEKYRWRPRQRSGGLDRQVHDAMPA